MKTHVEIECTPEEARRAIGLPDLTPIHERYVTMMLESMSGGLRPETIDQMTRSWGPMGEAGLSLWRQLVEAGLSDPTGTGAASTAQGKSGSAG